MARGRHPDPAADRDLRVDGQAQGRRPPAPRRARQRRGLRPPAGRVRSLAAGAAVVVRRRGAGHRPLPRRRPRADRRGRPRHRACRRVRPHRHPGLRVASCRPSCTGSWATAEQVAALARCHTVLVGGGGLDADAAQAGRGAGRPRRRHLRLLGDRRRVRLRRHAPRRGRASTIGADGRVRIAGPTLFSHYDDDPELTAETVVDGWFLTSDAGRFDEDGRLQVLGRIDDVVISGGVKIPVAAVAARLREHLLVERRRGPRRARRRVGPAASSPSSSAPPTSAELRDWVSRVHPRSWAPREFVWVDEPAAAAQRQGGPAGPPGRPVAPLRCTSSPSRCAPGSAASPCARACCCAATPAGASGRPSSSTTTPPSRPWLACAREAADEGWPEPLRDRVPVNVTVPATDPERAHAIVTAGGCRTAKVKVAERGQTLADDLARVEAVRDALGPDGLIRVDANGAWDVDEAVRAIAALDRAAGGLEYVEQPVATVEDLAVVRRRVDVPIAADESIRRAEDPYRVRDLEAADIAVLKVQPLGGVRACLRIAEDIGLPVVVSSAVESSVGIAAGVALAAALPELHHACGLATVQLLTDDVVDRADAPGRRHAAGGPARGRRGRAGAARGRRRPGRPTGADRLGVGRAGSVDA